MNKLDYLQVQLWHSLDLILYISHSIGISSLPLDWDSTHNPGSRIPYGDRGSKYWPETKTKQAEAYL
jgi:hypothetical protein